MPDNELTVSTDLERTTEAKILRFEELGGWNSCNKVVYTIPLSMIVLGLLVTSWFPRLSDADDQKPSENMVQEVWEGTNWPCRRMLAFKGHPEP